MMMQFTLTAIPHIALVGESIVRFLADSGIPSYVVDLFRDNDRLSFVILTMIFLETCFWSCMFYYMILIDKVNIFGLKRYALKNHATYPNKSMVWECMKDVVVSHFLVRPILLFLAYPYIAQCLSFGSNLPSLTTIAWQLFVCVQVDDFLFYWLHRLFHYKYLYKYIHKRHHEYRYPIPLAVEWAHPIEEIVANTMPSMVSVQ